METFSDQQILPISILVVDDHDVYREGLCELLSHWDDVQVVGQAENGWQAVEMYRLLVPDLVLMDFHMPGKNGIEAAREIINDFPAARLVFMVVSKNAPDLSEDIPSGVCGYLQKDISSETLHRFLRGWAAGGKHSTNNRDVSGN